MDNEVVLADGVEAGAVPARVVWADANRRVVFRLDGDVAVLVAERRWADALGVDAWHATPFAHVLAPLLTETVLAPEEQRAVQAGMAR